MEAASAALSGEHRTPPTPVISGAAAVPKVGSFVELTYTGASELGDDDDDEGDVVEATEKESEDTAWAGIKKSDKLHGQVTIGGNKSFRILVFWANPIIRRKYRLRARVFLGVFAAVAHEATSESTFSYSGRAFNNKRTSMDPQQLCDSVVCVSGEKRRASSSGEIKEAYSNMKRARLVKATAAVSSSSSSSSSSSAPVAVVPVAVVPVAVVPVAVAPVAVTL